MPFHPLETERNFNKTNTALLLFCMFTAFLDTVLSSWLLSSCKWSGLDSELDIHILQELKKSMQKVERKTCEKVIFLF